MICQLFLNWNCLDHSRKRRSICNLDGVTNTNRRIIAFASSLLLFVTEGLFRDASNRCVDFVSIIYVNCFTFQSKTGHSKVHCCIPGVCQVYLKIKGVPLCHKNAKIITFMKFNCDSTKFYVIPTYGVPQTKTTRDWVCSQSATNVVFPDSERLVCRASLTSIWGTGDY